MPFSFYSIHATPGSGAHGSFHDRLGGHACPFRFYVDGLLPHAF